MQLPGFDVGPFHITYYGIILMSGALAGAWLASREATRRGQNVEFVWDGLMWVLIGGIVGARIWHILTPPPSMVALGITTQYYLTHPVDAISIWNGGLGIPGAVIGGGLVLYFFCKRRNVDFLLWADIAAPGVALGQAIGRWGNFINQELYGKPAGVPWAIRIDPGYRLPGFENIEYYHPLFLYESLWNFANLALLLWLARRYPKKLVTGDLFLIYLITYPLGRFLLEFLRLDPSMLGGINANQTVMAIVALTAAGILYWRHLHPPAQIKIQIVGEPVLPEGEFTGATLVIDGEFVEKTSQPEGKLALADQNQPGPEGEAPEKAD